MTLHQMLFYSCVLHCWYLLSSTVQNFRRCAFYSSAHVGSRTAGHEINSRHLPLKGPREVYTNIFCISLQSWNCNSFKTIDCTLACLYLLLLIFFYRVGENRFRSEYISFYTIMTWLQDPKLTPLQTTKRCDLPRWVYQTGAYMPPKWWR